MKGYAREKMREITADRSALRKCRNAVSAGVLSPISSAVGRNGAVGDKEALAPGRETIPIGDKESARAGARNYPRRRQILRLRRCAATPHPPPSGEPVSLRVGRFADLTRHRRVIQYREPPRGKALGDGGRSEKRLPWLKQAAASASAPVNVHAVLLTDNGDERLCPREYAANHCRV